ncbi:MAG: hypothetical protein QOG52_197 [Frankiaceae bacterium]|nr:hypothetical protein [Frankiaceae bacterium]
MGLQMHRDNALIDRLSDEVDHARSQEQEAYQTMRAAVPALERGPVRDDMLTPEMHRAVAAYQSAHDHRRALEEERRAIATLALSTVG